MIRWARSRWELVKLAAAVRYLRAKADGKRSASETVRDSFLTCPHRGCDGCRANLAISGRLRLHADTLDEAAKFLESEQRARWDS